MKRYICSVAIAAAITVLAACSSGSNPGPLQGTWRMSGVVPMTVTFRDGETEAMGMIEKVSYKVDGNDVLVTNLDGLMKGTTFRYTVVDANTVRTQLGVLRRVQ